MEKALGTLPNAPLIYVLAQIVFTRVPKMEDIWEDFHKRIFENYPESEVEHVQQFSIKRENLESSKETRWHMLDRARRKGLILHSNTLILHTTRYTTSNDFFDDLTFILNNFIEVLPAGIQVKRLGLRYIDLLLPSANLDVDKQASEKLGMFSFNNIGCTAVQSNKVANYKTKNGGELIFRHRQTTRQDVLPIDLFPNNLVPAPLLKNPKQENTIVGLLDFDHFVNIDIPIETKSIITNFVELQETTSKAFLEATTPEAKKIWKEEQ